MPNNGLSLSSRMPISAANDLTHEQRFLAKSITPITSEQVARQQAHDAAQKLSQARAEQDIRSTMDAFTHFAWAHRAAELDVGLLGMMMGPGQQTQQKPVSHTGSASMFGGAQMMFPIAGGNGAIPIDTTPSDVSNIAAYELPRTIAKLAEVGDSLNSVAYLGEAITNQDPVTKAHVSTESALIGAGLSLAGLFGGEGVVARLVGGGAEGSALSRVEYLTQKYGCMTSQERMMRIDKLSMQNYERRAWELIRSRGYANRYLSESTLSVSRRFGVVRGYSTTIDSDSSVEVAKGAQIKPEWGVPKYRTVVPADSINSIRIARPFGDTGSYGWEFFANSYPEAGPGGWPQFIIDDVDLEDVQLMGLKP